VLALGIFQSLLNGIGWVLAQIYDLIGNYGVSIIVLTILIKLVLLPLGIKQIKSMQAMQSIQPKIKEIQKKYKGNKQRVQEETMKLYKEAGVNPLGGCLPLLLQFPILIAMYAVIRSPLLEPVTASGKLVYEIHNDHLPIDSQLFENVILHQNLNFLGVNLQCSAAQSGTQAVVNGTNRQPVKAEKPIVSSDGGPLPFPATTGPPNQDGNATLPCGSKPVDKIPYFVLLAFMVATTFYQQRQMQKASPPGAASGQQQAILKVMPIMFGFFGYAFPAGLTLYWTTSNLWQIGQQYALLKAGHIGPDAMERRIAEQRTKNANKPPKPGLIARMQDRAVQERKKRDQTTKNPKPSGSGGRKPSGGSSGTSKGSGSKGSPGSRGPQPKQRRPNTGKTPPGQRPNTNREKPGSGGNGDKGDGETGT
jgi:YidC/Oxa1 family membrane protein insertase